MFADPGGVIRTVGRYDTANSVWLLQHRLTDEFGNLYALVGDVAGLADAYHTQGYFMTEYNQRPLAVRLLFVAIAVICFGQAYRIAAAVGGRAEAAAVAQTSAVSAANLPRYVEKPIEEIRAGDYVLARNEVTGELAPGQVRTAAENAQARNFFKHNRDSARQWWEERTGRQWPSDATHYEHPRPLADGGDPLFVEPGFGGPNAPHMIPGPDGLTDFQRWGSRGGRPRSN